MKFVKRDKAPSTSDKYWIHYSKGGLNKCILIEGNSCLPNCVGYCWGRWYELLGSEPKLARTNAETWYLNTKDGYQRSQTPKLGAVACWSLGSASTGDDGCGHVAIVETINQDGSIVISESNYGGTRWRLITLKKGYAYGSRLKFQGFICPPIEWDGETPKSDEPTFVNGKIYTTQFNVNVRFGPGTNYARKTKAQLSQGAQPYALPNGTIKKGTQVTCLESAKDKKNNTWVRIPSGWIPAYYDKDICIK